MKVSPVVSLSLSMLGMSCNLSLHASGSGLFGSKSSSDPAAAEPAATSSPAPAEAAAPESAPAPGPSRDKRGRSVPVDDGSTASPLLGAAPVMSAHGAAPPAAWAGTYGPGGPLSCEEGPVFNPAGPDTQTVHVRHGDIWPGFRCPATCANAATITFAKGKLSVPLVWVDDNVPEDKDGFAVTMHRYKFDIPLEATADKGRYGGEARVTTAAKFRWSQNGANDTRSDGFLIGALLASIKDVHSGTGLAAAVRVLPHTPGYTDNDGYDPEALVRCEVEVVRGDWKPGDGLVPEEAGAGDDGDTGDTASTPAGGDRGARRSCVNSCRSEGGSCRTACHGSSAKCAADCNHEEKSCEQSC